MVGIMGREGSTPGDGAKGQHFLLSTAARTLSVVEVARYTEKKAFDVFCKVRWSETRGEPVCLFCDCIAVYKHKKRQIFSCKACEKQFSVTSGTLFHGRKLKIRDILTVIAHYANSAKGYNALQMSRDLNCQYKTAFVLLHKLREGLGVEISSRTAKGVVEVDGVYIGGKIRPANYKSERVDRRLGKNRNGKMRVVTVMRERNGRTLPFVVRSEAASVRTLAKRIAPGSVVHVDEAKSWEPLMYSGLEMKRINHQEAYSDGEACTNQAESFFSRVRRSEKGIHHHISGPYLGDYVNELAWREDARRIDNRTQYLLVSQAALSNPPSVRFKGYWQRSKSP